MKRRALTVVLVVLVALSGVANTYADDEHPTQIRLDQVWAYDMPGTQDIRELEPKLLPQNLRTLQSAEQQRVLHNAEISKIKESLSTESPSLPPENGTAKAGFIVLGTASEALHAAMIVLVDGKSPATAFNTTDQLNLVFFAHSMEGNVHIRGINREDNALEIQYEILPYTERHVTPTFAIIPLGKLPPGKFSVHMMAFPLAKQFLDKGYKPISDGFKRRMVCGSFSFDVQRR